MPRIYTRRPLLDRILDRVQISDCWLFTGAIAKRTGYGVVGRGGQADGTAYVHRALYELLVGPVPAGLDLDHLCRVRHCCNPDHLQPVTRQVNVDRGARGRGKPQYRKAARA